MFPKLKFKVITDKDKVESALKFAKYAIEQMPDEAWGKDDETGWRYKFDFLYSIDEALDIMENVSD